MVPSQMTRSAAISLTLLAIIVLALIVLLAWPTHSASDSPVGADDLAGMVGPRVSQANIQVTICPALLDADRAASAGGDRRHQATSWRTCMSAQEITSSTTSCLLISVAPRSTSAISCSSRGPARAMHT
jgi:hypothetical protein